MIGGGTYAREMENAIAYGALYPGDPDVMHEADEFIRIDRLILIEDLCRRDLSSDRAVTDCRGRGRTCPRWKTARRQTELKKSKR